MTKEVLSSYAAFRQRQAEAIARHPLVRRPRLRMRFSHFAGVTPRDHVLDVGSGPGFNAFAFARVAASVNGVDPSALMVETARKQAVRRLRPPTFTQAAAESLPFPSESFDLVTSAAALHHFDSPQRAILEIARVCRAGGRVAIEDVIASEQDVRARYHNRIERLRDRSHRRCLPLSEIISLLGEAGLQVRKVLVQESLRELDEWLAVTRPPPRRAEQVRRLLQGSMEQDLVGLRVQPVDDTFLLVQQVAWVLAINPE